VDRTRVLGVDPGTRFTGWAVLEAAADGRSPTWLASGVIRLASPAAVVSVRLLRLRRGLEAVLAEWLPQSLALEAAFFGRNARSALRLGEARGAVMVTAAEAGLAVEELAPALVKRRVAGAGQANKDQLARMVRLQLELDRDFDQADETDAIAIALCALLERSAPTGAVAGPLGARPA